jgi:hypothetical protein
MEDKEFWFLLKKQREMKDMRMHQPTRKQKCSACFGLADCQAIDVTGEFIGGHSAVTAGS